MSGVSRISPPKKRLAIYLPHMEGGGVQKVVASLLPRFLRAGLQVDLLLNHRRGLWLSAVPEEVRVLELKAMLGSIRIASLVGYLERERPAALFSALEGPNFLSSLVKRLGLSGGTRVVVSVRNMDSSLIRLYPWGVKRFLFSFLYPGMLAWADHIVAVSQGVKDLYLTAGGKVAPDHVTVIHNPVDARFLEDAMGEGISEEWFRRDPRPFLLGAGRLEPQKDFGTLLRAFALVRRSWDGRLLILGEGRERERLERSIRELELERDVLMPGHAPNPWKFMGRAEAFVLSSAHEGFGNVLPEAMAAGLPIVSTDCPSGPSEILERGKWGGLVPVGDAEAMARAILSALKGPRRLDYSDRSRDFTPEKAVARYLRVLGLEAG